jgi:hypothetical protein
MRRFLAVRFAGLWHGIARAGTDGYQPGGRFLGLAQGAVVAMPSKAITPISAGPP